LKAQLQVLRRRRVHFSGFSATLHSSIPAGLGLGEGAAATLALTLALRRQYPFTFTELGADVPPRRNDRGHLPPLTEDEKRIVARWCGEAWSHSGAFQGERFDPWPALFGRAWHVTAIDCRFSTVDRFGLIGEGLVLCDTGRRADRTPGKGTHEVEIEGLAASRALMAKSLRSVDSTYLRVNRSRLTQRQHAVAYHVIGEIQRVVYAERALRDEDHAQAGYYLRLSHASAQEHLGTSWGEADVAVALASSIPGCLGARMIGPGGGGAVICLVSYHEIARFVEQFAVKYRQETGRDLQPIVLPMADGVSG
jgi:galactokinase